MFWGMASSHCRGVYMEKCMNCHKIFSGKCKDCLAHQAELSEHQRKIDEHIRRMVIQEWRLPGCSNQPRTEAVLSPSTHRNRTAQAGLSRILSKQDDFFNPACTYSSVKADMSGAIPDEYIPASTLTYGRDYDGAGTFLMYLTPTTFELTCANSNHREVS